METIFVPGHIVDFLEEDQQQLSFIHHIPRERAPFTVSEVVMCSDLLDKGGLNGNDFQMITLKTCNGELIMEEDEDGVSIPKFFLARYFQLVDL